MTRPTWDADEHAPDRPHDERGHDDDDPTRRDLVEYEPNPMRRGRWLSAVAALLGVVLVGQAIALEPTASQFWNDILVGTAVIVLGGYNWYRRSNREFGSVGVATLLALVGLWLVASPFLFVPGTDALLASADVSGWLTVVVGLLVAVLGSYSAVSAAGRRRTADARPTAVYDRREQ